MSDAKKSPGFIPGGSLLTNIEDYSIRVRSEAEAYADELKREALEIQQKATKEAAATDKRRSLIEDEIAQMLASAKQEAEALLQKSQAQGYKAGYEQAGRQFNAEIADQRQRLEKILHSLSNFRETLFAQYEQKLAQLALLIAKKIIAAELSINREAVVACIKEVSEKFSKHRMIKVHLNRHDYDYLKDKPEKLKDFFAKDTPVSLVSDSKLKEGEIRLESDLGIVEKQIAPQLAKIEQLINAAVKEN